MQTDSTTKTIPRVCEHCGVTFPFPVRFIKEGHGRFCSNQCRARAWEAAHRTVRTCRQCGESFARQAFRDDVYCSTTCANTARRIPLEKRFWTKVNKTATCWLWNGAKHPFGYGKITIDGKPRDAHRVAWELAYGSIPAGLDVMHDCPGGDNPACVNPAHLLLGTAGDNIRDCVRKGRFKRPGYRKPPPPPPKDRQRGERHYGAKLTAEQVRAIRQAWQERSATQPELAARYGVTQATVNDAVLRKTWKHID